MDSVAPTWADFAAGWELGIYRDPILCGLITGLVLGYLGVLVVLRRAVFVTATISQASGLGVALAFFAGIHLGVEVPPVVGAVGASLVATYLLSLPTDRARISRESLLGLVYVVCSALAVIVGDRIAQEAHDIGAILFGTAVLVREVDLYLVAAVGGVSVLGHLLFHRGVVFAAFDRESARVQGVPVRIIDFASWVSIALTIAVATRALGVLPVFALAVLPAMAGLATSDRLRYVLLVAALVGGCAGTTGYLAAFFLELPVGACQTVMAFVSFLLLLPLRFIRRRTR